ncbi:MAG: (2Fe-2S)-binding protein [Planctomycetota bacterium]|nr:(2Fe-2S)-binding protein [Planctomycetota bacterium]
MSDDAPREEGARRGLTRRSLFKGAGAAAAAGAVFRSLDASAKDDVPAGPRTQGPGKAKLTLQVNGQSREVQAEPRETLLEVLRLPLDLTGAKPVCNRGQCGACTVWLDGTPVYACSVLAVEAEGRKVTTVEGLGNPDDMHAVQSAFVEKDALQCGFCTSGLVMSAAWAVGKHGPDLSEEQARAACSGNLCRCGTYPHVVEAAIAAAKTAKKGG